MQLLITWPDAMAVYSLWHDDDLRRLHRLLAFVANDWDGETITGAFVVNDVGILEAVTIETSLGEWDGNDYREAHYLFRHKGRVIKEFVVRIDGRA